ncbi:nicotinamide phosphoribosyltransferase-like [Dysidea avara]|uniref:nicotinamide phosphoribosyltransferase-like n=1 Tax=Dysidea avara TaxID=196820 RepID=UPI00332D8DDC
MAEPCSGNIIFITDSYKVSHHKQYPPNTHTVYSYFESRGGVYPETVFFGLQYILKKYFVGSVVTKEKIAEAKAVYDAHLGPGIFNEKGWIYIVEKHNGRLPIRIKAVPEGTVLPYKNVLFTVENTDPNCYWLTNYLETILVEVWYPMTVATLSRAFKEVIIKYLSETADNLDGLPLKLHDFGCRGCSSLESAALGGAAHLVNFEGTATIAAIIMARDYYGCPMAGYSRPGSEHSTMNTWGRENEVDAFRNMLTQFPNGTVACVSDSYNIWEACGKLWGEELKDLVEDRGKRGVGPLVVRPDSGDPPTTVVKVLTILGEKFGTTLNNKGYKLLPSYLRVVQGDGISYDTLGKILAHMKENGWSADNVAFGCGGGLLQKVNRDTQKCAYKCSYALVDGKDVNVFKEPITDMGKKSKKGRLTLEYDNGQWLTTQEGTGNPDKDQLVVVYENGFLIKDWTFNEIRTKAEIKLVKSS